MFGGSNKEYRRFKYEVHHLLNIASLTFSCASFRMIPDRFLPANSVMINPPPLFPPSDND
jgi:hypothetical protein